MTEEEMFTTDHGHDRFTIKAFIITMLNNNESVVGARKLLHSITLTNPIQPFLMQATIPSTIDLDIKCNFSKKYGEALYKDGKLWWNWPTSAVQDGIDFSTGLYKKYYGEKDWRTKAACTISHMRLWQHCIDINEPIMILEHDANFIENFRYRILALSGADKGEEWTGGICGLNNPIGTTRKAGIFDTKVKYQIGEIFSAKKRFMV
jgi:GR25 family glycosyltransferase involved in LPS biosynthesis